MLDRKLDLEYKSIIMPHFLDAQNYTLNNGVEVYEMDGGGQELCRLEFVFEAGTKLQEKPLQAAMCNAMLLEGTLTKTAEEIHEKIDFYGAYTHLDLSPDRAVVSLYTLNKYFDVVVTIFIDAIKNATFPKEDFDLLIEQRKQSFVINSEKVDFKARNAFFAHLYEGHSYGAAAVLEDFDKINREDLIKFHDLHYKQAALKVYIAGQLPGNTQELLNTLLGDWSVKASNPIGLYSEKTIADKIHIAKEGALQSAIRIGCVCFNSHHEDYHELKYLSIVLGGYFGSRLMSNIREDKGLTYGIGAICAQQEESGFFSISTEVKGESTGLALTEIYKELKRLREDLIPAEELDLVKNYIMGQILTSADGPFAQASLLKNMHVHRIGFDFYDTYQAMLNNLDSISLRDLANKYLKEEDLCEVVVGNISF
jgi:predicted Zn-dependent peptidase